MTTTCGEFERDHEHYKPVRYDLWAEENKVLKGIYPDNTMRKTIWVVYYNHFAKMKKINLYDYQQEMLENITKALTGRAQVTFYDQHGKKMKVGNSVMVQMPTGTGKTYVMAAVVKWFLEKYEKGEVWLIAHRKELVEQMQQTLDRFCLEYAEKEEELKEKVRIRVLSIQWLSRHIGEMEAKGKKPGFIVVDEAHHALADSYQDVFDRNRPALKMGMTATPCRMKKESFGGIHQFVDM